MKELTPTDVAASVSRARWGEVSSKLRSVQFRTAERRIDSRFFFDGDADPSEQNPIGCVGPEVAADFPDTSVSEETVGTLADSEIMCQQGWHTVYARRETSLAR